MGFWFVAVILNIGPRTSLTSFHSSVVTLSFQHFFCTEWCSFYLQTLFAMDQLDCGKRYLCELSASPLGSLNKDEKRSLTILQVERGPSPSSRKRERSFTILQVERERSLTILQVEIERSLTIHQVVRERSLTILQVEREIPHHPPGREGEIPHHPPGRERDPSPSSR